MSKTPERHNQFSLTLRLVAGGYLVYTAWNLRNAISENPLFIVAIVVFAVIGIALIVHSAWRLWKKDYEGAPGSTPEPEKETAEEEEQEQ